MVWNVWTVSVWVCGVKIISATVRHDATAWQVNAERELQRARAAGSEPQAAAAAAHTHTAEKEQAQTHTRAAAEDVALDVATLTAWYRTKSHVRDAERVARAAVRRGIGEEEAAEIRVWAGSRRRTHTEQRKEEWEIEYEKRLSDG